MILGTIILTKLARLIMSSGFVSEFELEEQRRLRQEEWEKVRKPDEPEEAPEQPYDRRTLFDRLEEQKQKKQMEYEEAHKLKNMIKGLDDDEVDFLDFVDRKKMEAEHLKELEEKQELMEFRKNVEKMRESALEERIQAEIRTTKVVLSQNTSSKSQQKLLKGVVLKRKPDGTGNTEVKRSKPTTPDKEQKANEDEEQKTNGDKEQTANEDKKQGTIVSPRAEKRKREEDQGCETESCPTLTCVGILPGLGNYEHSSDSESDSSVSDEHAIFCPKYDLLGRKVHFQTTGKAKSSL